MNENKRHRALELLGSLNESFKTSRCTGAVASAQESIEDAIGVLSDEKASYKASDYAVARTYAKISRLVGFRDLALSDQAHTAWRSFVDFVYGDASDDLRGVGGLNLG